MTSIYRFLELDFNFRLERLRREFMYDDRSTKIVSGCYLTCAVNPNLLHAGLSVSARCYRQTSQLNKFTCKEKDKETC